MKRFFYGTGIVLLTILKWIGLMALEVLKLFLEMVKIFLLLFGLIGRVFLAFVRIGTA
ncbi:MAG TPA: hypothetical protein VJY54_03690 [Lachnospiraceae bacterium]|nr:hypothetical protein [Lachnospiraceae bacterium]